MNNIYNSPVGHEQTERRGHHGVDGQDAPLSHQERHQREDHDPDAEEARHEHAHERPPRRAHHLRRQGERDQDDRAPEHTGHEPRDEVQRQRRREGREERPQRHAGQRRHQCHAAAVLVGEDAEDERADQHPGHVDGLYHADQVRHVAVQLPLKENHMSAL